MVESQPAVLLAAESRGTQVASQGGIRHRFSLTGAGVGFLLVILVVGTNAVSTNNNLLFLITTVLVGVAVGAVALPIRLLKGLGASRSLPGSAHVGEALSYQIDLNAPAVASAAAFLDVGDDRENGEIATDWLQPPVPAAAEPWGVSARFSPHQRGWLALPRLRLRCRLPFGWWEMTRIVETADRLLVYPERWQLARSFYATELASAVGLLNQASVTGPEQDEFAGLKEFRSGDNPRHIHWKASSRIPDQLLARQYDRSADRQVWIYLDTDIEPGARQEHRQALEDNICFVLALAEELCARECEVVFSAYAPDRVRIVVRGDRAQGLAELRRSLALLRPCPGRPVQELAARESGSQTACRVIVTLRPVPVSHARQPKHFLLSAEQVRELASPAGRLLTKPPTTARKP